MPNFLIIGAVKSGTTSLYHYLRQHPQIYMSPVKEPSFFAFKETELDSQLSRRRWASYDYILNIDDYRTLFEGVSDEVAIGEASPAYLIHPSAPKHIKHYVPDAKLIAILRDPVESIYSAYLMQRLYGRERLADFGQVIRRQETEEFKSWRLRQRYIDIGFYYTHLKRYFDIFDPMQIKIYIYDDFKAEPIRVLRNIFQFLGLNEAFIPDLSIKYNVGGIPRCKAWHTFFQIRPVLRPLVPATLRQHVASNLSSFQRRVLAKPPPVEPNVRRELVQILRADILELQNLIGRDLSGWLE